MKKRTACEMQINIISAYKNNLPKYVKDDYRSMSKNLGINITRLWRVINSYEMTLREAQTFIRVTRENIRKKLEAQGERTQIL